MRASVSDCLGVLRRAILVLAEPLSRDGEYHNLVLQKRNVLQSFLLRFSTFN